MDNYKASHEGSNSGATVIVAATVILVPAGVTVMVTVAIMAMVVTVTSIVTVAAGVGGLASPSSGCG